MSRYLNRGRPGYLDRFGNPVRVGDVILLARSQSGSLALGRVVEVSEASDPQRQWPVVKWQRWGSEYVKAENWWIGAWSPVREINPAATALYTGNLPPDMEAAL